MGFQQSVSFQPIRIGINDRVEKWFLQPQESVIEIYVQVEDSIYLLADENKDQPTKVQLISLKGQYCIFFLFVATYTICNQVFNLFNYGSSFMFITLVDY